MTRGINEAGDSDPRAALVLVDGWAGRREIPCMVVGETAARYRVKFEKEVCLPGRVLAPRQIALVPKFAVRFT